MSPALGQVLVLAPQETGFHRPILSLADSVGVIGGGLRGSFQGFALIIATIIMAAETFPCANCCAETHTSSVLFNSPGNPRKRVQALATLGQPFVSKRPPVPLPLVWF